MTNGKVRELLGEHYMECTTPILALVSDFGPIPATREQILCSQKEYYKVLENLGIRSFFEPVAQRVTLSTEVGKLKPAKEIFQAVIEKIPSLHFADVMFITEDRSHVEAATLVKIIVTSMAG
jgi:hypothetical protein